MVETLDESNRTEIVETLGAAFCNHPLLPSDPSGRKARLLIKSMLNAFQAATDVQLLGIRRDACLGCAALVFDADYEPRGLRLFLFLCTIVRVFGWRMTRTFAQVLSAKPEREERRLELLLLGTRADCQGLGLGRTMIHHIFEYARDRGYHSVVLEVPKETPAFRFYLREGFQVEKEIDLPTMPLCLLRRPLDEPGTEEG